MKGTDKNIFIHIRFEAFTAVTMENAVFWDVVLCRSCVLVQARSIQRHIPEDGVLHLLFT
jgi:hypothetical protein